LNNYIIILIKCIDHHLGCIISEIDTGNISKIIFRSPNCRARSSKFKFMEWKLLYI